ncbi:MAG: hypothetical protein WD904_10300 [Dehalococcoidia bacterium]
MDHRVVIVGSSLALLAIAAITLLWFDAIFWIAPLVLIVLAPCGVAVLLRLLLTGGSLQDRAQEPALRSAGIMAVGGALVFASLLTGHALEDASAPLVLRLPTGFVLIATLIGAPLLAARQVRGLWAWVAGSTAFLVFAWTVVIVAESNSTPPPDADSNLDGLVQLIFAAGIAPFAGALIGFLSQLGKRRAASSNASA